jgi:hypothetical protein
MPTDILPALYTALPASFPNTFPLQKYEKIPYLPQEKTVIIPVPWKQQKIKFC